MHPRTQTYHGRNTCIRKSTITQVHTGYSTYISWWETTAVNDDLINNYYNDNSKASVLVSTNVLNYFIFLDNIFQILILKSLY